MSRTAVKRCGWLAAVMAGLGLAAWGLVLADDQPGEEAKEASVPADLSLISANAGGFACLHAAELWDSDFGKSVRENLKEIKGMEEGARGAIGVAPGDIERVTIVLLTPPPPELKARTISARPGQGPANEEEPPAEDTEDPVVILRTRKPYDRDSVLEPVGTTQKKKVGERTVHVGRADRAVCLVDDRTLVLGSSGPVRLFLSKEPAREGPLSESLKQAAGKHLLVAGLNGSNLHRLDSEHLSQQEKLVMAMLRPLLHARATQLVADLDEELHLKLAGTFASEGQARAAAKSAGGVEMVLVGLLQEMVLQPLAHDREMASVVAKLKKAATALAETPFESKGKTLSTSVSIPFDSSLALALASLPEQMQRDAGDARSINNLKQIGLALHNYHDSFGTFPPQAISSKDGKPLLSWRVAILPYIEQQNLYQQFKQDEPWDSEHNRKLLRYMPRVYASPADPRASAQQRTHYLGFAGPGAFFDGAKGLRISDIPDGTSNTIMVVESSAAVPWTKPEDIPFDPEKKLPAIGGLHRDGFVALLCDGSVHVIKKKVSKETLLHAIQRNDGNVLGADWLR